MDRGDETRVEFRVVVRRGFAKTTGEIIRRWTFRRQFRVRSGIEVFRLEDWFRGFEDLTEGLLKRDQQSKEFHRGSEGVVREGKTRQTKSTPKKRR